VRVVTRRLPCEFRRAIEVVAEAIEREKPPSSSAWGRRADART
jgi:hypothetical protein